MSTESGIEMTADRFRELRVLLLGMFIAIGGVVAPSLLPAQNLPVQTDGAAEQVTENATDEPTAKPSEPATPTDAPHSEKQTRQKLKFTKQGGVVYQKIDGQEIKCDIYTPAGEGPFPAILAVHGGAWRQGSKFALLRHAWKMAQAGYVVVSINYRHAPQYPFPAQVHDCKHAIRWMKSRASEMKLDPDRIGAFGYSAGGHLVSLLGTSDSDDGLEGDVSKELEKFDTRVQAVAAGGAPCEFSWISDDSAVLTYWLGGTPLQKPEAFRAASPTTYVTDDDPAFFFFHGESDLIVPSSSSRLLHETLEKSGVETQHFIAKGAGHFYTFSDLQWMKKAIDFFDKHLKNEGESSNRSQEEAKKETQQPSEGVILGESGNQPADPKPMNAANVETKE